MSEHDERPSGWGVCQICRQDCEEQDYNPRTQTSVHKRCADLAIRLQAFEKGTAA